MTDIDVTLMATDTEDGVDDADLADLAHGDGSAFATAEGFETHSHGKRKKKGDTPGAGDPSSSSGGGGPARSFSDQADSKAFIDDHYGEWKGGLTGPQETGISFYQSPGFALMNGQLRGGAELDAVAHLPAGDLARAKKATAGLKSAIDTAPPLTEAVQVHRGFSADQFDLKPGATIKDKGFVSTSTTPDVGAVGKASSPAVASIRLPAGTKAAAGTSRELILPPGSSFTVLSVSKKGKTTYVELELVA